MSATASVRSLCAILMLPAIGALALLPAASHAADLPPLAVIALGPMDGRAVIKTGDGRMHVLKVGDPVAGTDARLLQVLTDRIVLEDPVRADGGDLVRELVWVFKADARGRSVQQRLSRTAPATPPAVVPH